MSLAATRNRIGGADAPLAAELGDIVASLGRHAQEADAKLLAAGEGLSVLVAILEELTRQFEGLPQALEDADLQEASRQIGSLAGEIADLADGLVAERTALSDLAQLNRKTGTAIQRLSKTVHAITTLAINARIEAAHVDVRGEDFSAFAGDIARLARTTEATAQSYLSEHERLTQILEAACQAQAAFGRSHEAVLRSAGQQLTASIETIALRRAEAAAAAAEIGRGSKRIGREIGAAVMGLQIGDITRQRLEHVGEALGMLRDGLLAEDATRPAASWAASLDDTAKSAVAGTLCRMQSAQTIHAATELSAELDRIAASLKHLAEESAAILRLGRDVYGTAQQQEGGSFLDGLRAKLASAGALVRACQTARGEVDETVAALAGSLRELLDRLASVRGIETDMRLVGLNTALRCGRLGSSGRTLSIVAQELRLYARQTVQDADGLMAALEDITAAADGFERDRRDRGADRMAALDRVMATALGPFEESATRLGQALSALQERGGRVGGMLQDIAQGVAGELALGKALTSVGERLERLADDTPAEAADAALVRERLAHFATGRYTMASERDIHARFLPEASPTASSSAAAAPAPSADAALDDILF